MTRQEQLRVANARLMRRLVLVAFGAFGFAFALVPLYDIACEKLFGIKLADGGTAPVAPREFAIDTSRTVTVTFDSHLAAGLAWEFEPVVPKVEVHPGEAVEVLFRARNRADVAVVGQAVPSVAPNTASIYFAKTECFCFTRQRLDGGEHRDMPVRFVIDPAIPASIDVLTLSYTFYLDETATQSLAAAPAATVPAG